MTARLHRGVRKWSANCEKCFGFWAKLRSVVPSACGSARSIVVITRCRPVVAMNCNRLLARAGKMVGGALADRQHTASDWWQGPVTVG